MDTLNELLEENDGSEIKVSRVAKSNYGSSKFPIRRQYTVHERSNSPPRPNHGGRMSSMYMAVPGIQNIHTPQVDRLNENPLFMNDQSSIRNIGEMQEFSRAEPLYNKRHTLANNAEII